MFYGLRVARVGRAAAFNARVAQNPSLKLFGPSGLDSPLSSPPLAPAASEPVRLVARVHSERILTAGRAAVRDGVQGHVRSCSRRSEAIFGYEAMAAVLDVIHKAGQDANNRRTVVQDFFAIRDRPQSVLGPYSINAAGDTSIAPFVFNRVRAGAAGSVQSSQVQG